MNLLGRPLVLDFRFRDLAVDLKSRTSLRITLSSYNLGDGGFFRPFFSGADLRLIKEFICRTVAYCERVQRHFLFIL